MIISIDTFEGAEELFLSSLIYFTLSVFVISIDGWTWSLARRQLVIKSIPYIPLSQLDGLQLKGLDLIIYCVLEVSQVPNQFVVISGHVTKLSLFWSHTL